MLFPIVPSAEAAEPTTCVEACDWLPLYVRTEDEDFAGFDEGMSALPGDAVPGGNTEAFGRLKAITRPIDGILLAREKAFNVTIFSPSSHRYVRGEVTIFAVDAAGSRTTLANARFVPPAELAMPVDASSLPIEPSDLGPVFGAVQGQLRGVADNVVGVLGSAGTPVGLVADQAYGTLCVTPDNVHCRVISGRPLIGGAFAVCESSSQPLLRQTVAQVDGNVYGVAGRRAVCHAYSSDVNATADTADTVVGPATQTIGNAAGDTVENIGHSVNDSVGGLPVNASAAAHEWRSFSLNATVPPWMPQNDHDFWLPNGYRLAIDIDLDGVVGPGPNTSMPLHIEYGTDAARTGFAIRHATPGSFSRFAYDAAPILPGTHTGHASTPSDADDYQFVAPAGGAISLVTSGASAELFDPDGARLSGSNITVFPTSAAGLWTIRVRGSFLPANEYTFRLRVQDAVQDAEENAFVEQGWVSGGLGSVDEVDRIHLFAWKAQRFTLQLYHPTDADFSLRTSGMPTWGETYYGGPGYEAVSARAEKTGWMTLEIARVHGTGTYQLGYFPDIEGNLTYIPSTSNVMPLPTQQQTDLFGYGDGVFFSNASALFYYSPSSNANASVPIRIGPGGPMSGISAEGGLLRAVPDSGQTVLAVEVNGVPRQLATGQGRFGHDALYGVDGSSQAYRMTADRAIESFGGVATGTPADKARLLAHPDGSMYLVRSSGSLRFDLAASTLVPAPHMDGVWAVDHGGGLYRVLNSTLIERVDPWSGYATVVAQAPSRIESITSAGPYVYAWLAASAETSWTPMLAIVNMAHRGWGFDGFEPSFAPAPAPDLRVTDIRETEVETDLVNATQTRTIEVSITNTGGSRAGAFNVWFSVPNAHLITPAQEERNVTSLEPGETTVLSFRWAARAALGDRLGHVLVDPRFTVVESDERNNQGEFWTQAWIGGDHEICMAATEDLPGGPPSVPIHPMTICRAMSGG